MGAAAAIIAARHGRIIRTFRVRGATSVNTARSLNDLALDDDLMLRGLIRRAVVREASPGTYYLDEVVYDAMMSRRRAIAVVMAVIVLVAGFFVALVNVSSR